MTGDDEVLSLLAELADAGDDEALAHVLDGMPDGVVDAALAGISLHRQTAPPTPLAQAVELDPGYVERAHLRYLSDRLAQAVTDVEQGRNRFLAVSMPPRMGKSQLTSVYLPTWILRRHADWKLGLISHSPHLAVGWGRQIRRMVEERHDVLGLRIAADAGAAADWQTEERGSVTARSAPGQSITGLGFKVLLIDDPVKDYATAHSPTSRDSLWDWWVANAQTRLEPPWLVVAVGTRWHEDDLIGRLVSDEHEGDPAEIEVISFPAIAEQDDVLGRSPGEPLLSPLLPTETPEQALNRWDGLRRAVGSYAWASLYQQRPSPAEGAIFNIDQIRYWTTDPTRVTGDGRVILLPTPGVLARASWLDSWDLSFGDRDTSTGSYVVGQRWAKLGEHRYLIAQQRGRWAFTQTVAAMKRWTVADGTPASPFGQYVTKRLIEKKANGAAAIDVLRDSVTGIKAVTPTASKEARARLVTPPIERGEVYLPDPGQPGHEWVTGLLSELRNFPNDAHDDQVDALTQALSELTDVQPGRATVPRREIPRNRAAAALTDRRRSIR